MPTTFNMSDVMISYSRRDKAFVQGLGQALQATGREIWVDWLDIPPTVDFLQEIYAGIEAANTFVFVISPDSARSEVCGMEVQHAVEFNKRLVPVLYRELTQEDLTKLHPAVASHNWIYVREQDNFDNSFKTLITALETDLEHVQLHTKLLVLAREWESEGRRGGFLLRGDELRDAETWLTNGVSLRPEPTALQAEYIAASRKAAARARNIIGGAMAAALVILSLLALFAFQQSGLANTQLGVSNQRGTAVAQQVETANAALTQVQERENARATAQQDAANSLKQANANATLSENNAATANANATLSQNNAATATRFLATAIAAQDLADSNLATATVAQGQAQDALTTAQAAQASADAAQGTAQANLATAQAAQGTAQAAQVTANAAQASAQAAQATANAAQATAQAAQATANAAGTEAALAQARANSANTQVATAQTQVAIEQKNAFSLSLASAARAALLQGKRPLAMSLALMAVTMIETPSAAAIDTLHDIAESAGERFQLQTGGSKDILNVGLNDERVYADDGTNLYAWNIPDDANQVNNIPVMTKPDAYADVSFSPDGTVALVYRNINLFQPYSIGDAAFIPGTEVSGFLDLTNHGGVADLVMLKNNQQFVLSLDEADKFAVHYLYNLSVISMQTPESVNGASFSTVHNLAIIPGSSDNLTNLYVLGLIEGGLNPRLGYWTIAAPADGHSYSDFLPGWTKVAFAPDRSSLLYIQINNATGINQLILATYTETSTFTTQFINQFSLSSEPISVAYQLILSDYAAHGGAAAVVGQKNGIVTVLDLPPNGDPVPTDAINLITWVCDKRYRTLLIDPKASDWPANISDDARDQLIKSMKNKCDDPDTPSQIVAAVPLSIAPPVAAVPTPSLTPTSTPTPDITFTPSMTPTLDPNAPQLIDSSDAQVSLSGNWQPVENPQANGGSYLISSVADDSLGLIFNGTAISIIYYQHPSMGSFNVEIDGTLLGSVRETGNTILFRQVPISGLTPGIHTLRLVPAQNPIVIDAFVINPPIDWLPGALVTATPSPTVAATLTPTASWTPSLTPELSLTSSATMTPVDMPETLTPTATAGDTTETPTPTEMPTLTETPSATWTMTATEVWTNVPAATLPPTDAPTATLMEVETVVPTETLVDSDTVTG